MRGLGMGRTWDKSGMVGHVGIKRSGDRSGAHMGW